MPAHRTVELNSSQPCFPVEVRAMSKPPSRLYLRGRLPSYAKSVAIIGTRQPCPEALRFARELAARACMNGWSVWSGGAAGIDSAAHQGALDVNGTSVVVMGTGFDHPYPAHNRELFDRVLEADGAWLSLYPPEQVAARWTFLPRNELLAAMVQHIVIVQAPLRSGARSTMAAARRMAKHLWAVPAAPWHSSSAGCLQEICAGATMLLSADQLFGPPSISASQRGTRTPNQHKSKHYPIISSSRTLDETEHALVKILRHESVNFDVLCDKSGISASQVSRAILTLTLQGVVVENIDGSFCLL